MQDPDLIVLRREGMYCPAGGFFIDPWEPVAYAIITHGHGDHARAGNQIYHSTRACLPILQWRLGEQRYVVHDYGVPFELGGVRVSLHAAGHVLGSAQVRVEVDGQVWVVSGDYKRQPDGTCAPFEAVACDVFVTESTFGLPVYRWPETRAVAREILEWKEGCGARGEVAILYAYALGKAQRLLHEISLLTDEPVWLHGAMGKGVQVYRDAGIALANTRLVSEAADGSDFTGQLVLAPPSAAGSPWLRRFKRAQQGVISVLMQNVAINHKKRLSDKGLSEPIIRWPHPNRDRTGPRSHGAPHPLLAPLRPFLEREFLPRS